MKIKQGDLSLLDHPVAQKLMQSKVPAQLASSWPDGSPRVVPIWFHWNGKEVIPRIADESSQAHSTPDEFQSGRINRQRYQAIPRAADSRHGPDGDCRGGVGGV